MGTEKKKTKRNIGTSRLTQFNYRTNAEFVQRMKFFSTLRLSRVIFKKCTNSITKRIYIQVVCVRLCLVHGILSKVFPNLNNSIGENTRMTEIRHATRGVLSMSSLLMEKERKRCNLVDLFLLGRHNFPLGLVAPVFTKVLLKHGVFSDCLYRNSLSSMSTRKTR